MRTRRHLLCVTKLNMRKRLRLAGLVVTRRTSPIVTGNPPPYVGGYVEVRGLTGDLDDFDVVLSKEDIMELKERPRFGVAAQTSQPIEKVRLLVSVLRLRFPKSEVRFIDTVCQPTKQRQHAAVELAH